MRNKSNVCIWKVSLVKSGKKKIFKELYFIGEHLLQISHFAYSYIYGDDESNAMFDFDVDVKNICKVDGIDDIVNGHSMDEDMEEREPDLDWPYKMIEVNKNFPEQLKIEFKHSCGNIQKIGNFPWKQMECRDCKKIINHDQLEEVGGKWLFHEK